MITLLTVLSFPCFSKPWYGCGLTWTTWCRVTCCIRRGQMIARLSVQKCEPWTHSVLHICKVTNNLVTRQLLSNLNIRVILSKYSRSNKLNAYKPPGYNKQRLDKYSRSNKLNACKPPRCTKFNESIKYGELHKIKKNGKESKEVAHNI